MQRYTINVYTLIGIAHTQIVYTYNDNKALSTVFIVKMLLLMPC